MGDHRTRHSRELSKGTRARPVESEGRREFGAARVMAESKPAAPVLQRSAGLSEVSLASHNVRVSFSSRSFSTDYTCERRACDVWSRG